MNTLNFYDVVGLKNTTATRSLGVVDASVVIVGISRDEGSLSYAVLIDGETYSVDQEDVSATGRRLKREDICSGESLKVDLAGRALDGTFAETARDADSGLT